jgi:hypothetical protein
MGFGAAICDIHAVQLPMDRGSFRASNFVLYLHNPHSTPSTALHMRTPILPLAALLFIATSGTAQIDAGDAPQGTSAYYPGIDIQLATQFTSGTEQFDLDCDSIPDIAALLVRGEPAIDAPNSAWLNLLHPGIELCKDMAMNERPQYYTAGQLLDCSGAFTWQTDSFNVLGDMGTFGAIGPFVVDSMYVAYRMGVAVGWILVSFDLTGGVVPVWLQINEALQLCGPNSVGSLASAPALQLLPNPGHGGPIQLQSAEPFQRIEVLDLSGKVLAQYSGSVRTIASPEVAGTYLVRAWYADGRRAIGRLVRY